MNLIEKALEIALKAHAGQTDKAGQPYILHPLRIMAKMEMEDEKVVAILHDVIEDSDFTAEQLIEDGIPEHIVEAVQVLSKKEGEGYPEFIDRVVKNKLAAKIKKADIEDNLNILRFNALSENDLKRVAKYHSAWKKLESHNKS